MLTFSSLIIKYIQPIGTFIMDKRTILFVGLLTATLFMVNIFFENRNRDRIQEWSVVQKSKKEQKIAQLESLVSQKAVKESDLPLVKIFSDSQGKDLLGRGLLFKDDLLTLSWINDPQKTVYILKNNAQNAFEEYHLSYSSSGIDTPILYHSKEKRPLNVGELPTFGKFDLQLVRFRQNHQESLKIFPAEYVDGTINIFQDTIDQIHSEIALEKDPVEKKTYGNAIVLIKGEGGFIPVAFYEESLKRVIFFDQMPSFKDYVAKPKVKESISSNLKGEEKFYVLENSYQQLVFSNVGGALIEVNLPFADKGDKESVVKEIEFDRDMVSNHPYNAHFPAHAYYTASGNGSDPIKHLEGKLGGYYPLLRRDLVEAAPRKSIRIPPRYYAMNIISEYPEMAELFYQVTKFDNKTIVFEASQGNRKITKTFSIEGETSGAPYCVNATIKIEGDSRGLWLTTGVPEVEWISGAPAPAMKYRITRNKKVEVDNIDLPTETITVSSIYPDWICNSNGFLGMILDPLSEIDPGYRAQHVSGVVVPSRLVEVEEDYNRYKAQDLPGYMMMLPLKSAGGEMNFRFFAGPFAESILKQVDATYSDPKKNYNPDYIACQSFHGWFAFISEPFAKFLFILMKFFHSVTGSWAFSIILLTVALRIMLYPLNAWSTKSMVKMQEIGPEVTAIQEKNKKDPKKAQIEIMNLYREKGVNPVSGCFPLLIQMPFLIGMFDLLKSTFELRGASFIPGWIDNLTAPDVLFSWSTPIFFIGNQFHLLPILLGGVMFIQQRFMSTLPKDPNLLTDQQRQQKAMGSIMTVVFAVMFYNFPSGLNIYWLSSMLLGILQQWWTAKQMKKKASEKPVIILPVKKNKK
jgi:YidC/Oxa1 family membrane protein insertase